jgi:hypothetical protein
MLEPAGQGELIGVYGGELLSSKADVGAEWQECVPLSSCSLFSHYPPSSTSPYKLTSPPSYRLFIEAQIAVRHFLLFNAALLESLLIARFL